MPLNSNEVISLLTLRNLNAGYNSLVDIPHFSLMKDMILGAKRLADAVRNKEDIYCIADYDADGSCAGAVCVSFFDDINYPIKWLIPDRFTDGYGVSPTILRRIEHADVIFTVDNGIVAHEAAKVCRERDIDLIITDHHTPGEKIPDCYAVIDPQQSDCTYPFKEISGCFVAWLLCSAIKHELGLNIDMRKYLDLVALSTITDVMPLTGINRHVVQYGLKKINTFKRPFFKELALSMNREYFTYEDLGFQIGPRINAAGRLKNASIAVKALLANDIEAKQCVYELTDINQYRKTIQNDALEDILKLANGQTDFIVVYSANLHEGIIGIIAAKIAETIGYPTIILTNGTDGLLKGSGRTVGTVDIFKLVNENSHYLEKFGGHAGACGLSLKKENLDIFTQGIRNSSAKLPRESFKLLNTAIGELHPTDINLDFYYQLEQFAPFGESNEAPVFQCMEATVLQSKPVGKERDHTRLTLNWKGTEISIMAFNCHAEMYPKNSKVTFNYRLSINKWNGKTNLQLLPTNGVKIK